MAIFHLKMQILCRSHGRSLLASAAYRAGVRLHDEWQDVTFDYTRRKHVAFSRIYLPRGAPSFMTDREKLWNFAQARERRKDSQLAREMHVALPLELTATERVDLIERYVRREFISQGLVVDCSIHENPGNPHAHLIISMRRVTADGFSNKCREMNGRDYLQNLRERWSRSVNAFLMEKGHSSRIDHRSHAERQTAANDKPPNNYKEINMAKTTHKPAPAEFSYPRHRQKQANSTRLATPSICSVVMLQGEVRPELFNRLERYLEETLRQYFEGNDFRVLFDHKTQHYSAWVDGIERIRLSRDRITCMSGNEQEVRLCIQACIDFGWKRIRLSGSEDFKRRAYSEALSRGYSPSEIEGYAPPQVLESAWTESDDGASSRLRHSPVNSHPYRRPK